METVDYVAAAVGAAAIVWAMKKIQIQTRIVIVLP